jgi:hypothetical protein
MAALTTPWQLSNRTLRQMGWLLAGVLALAGHVLPPSPVTLGLQLGGAVVFAVGTVRPRALWPVYLLLVWPPVWLALRIGSIFVRQGLAADLAESTARRLRPPRRLPQP